MRVRAIVGLAFGDVAEGGIGFGDLNEALRSTWVIGVAVWVVGFGEVVEGSVVLLAVFVRGSEWMERALGCR